MPEPNASNAAKPRILIVEDEGLIAGDIKQRLLGAGYEVVGIADTGESAIRAIGETSPDLILMDIRLKGPMDGVEAAWAIREVHDLPVVYLTAHSDAGTLERARVTEPFGYLAKPIGQASLPTSIEVALWKHRTERELRRQRAWLNTILSSMADGIIVVDADSVVEFMNPAAEALTGWTAENARGESLSTVFRLFAPDLDRFVDNPVPGVLAGESPKLLESGLQLAHQKGQYIPIEGEIAPSRDGAAILGAVVSFRDATARRIEEHELRQQHKLQAVSCLAAGVAHDFNNELTVIQGYAELLRDGLPSGSPLVALVGEISAAARRSAEVTRRMLAVGAVQPAPVQLLNLNATLVEWKDFCRALLGPRIQLEFALDSAVQDVLAHPGDLEEVLINLLTNARNALPGGGRVSVATANVSLADGQTATPDYVALSVRDNGIGMDPAVAERVFEPFFTSGPRGHGTGLGLFIAHNIINDLGGSISVDSRPGHGAEFTVYLPAARQSRPVDLADLRPAGNDASHCRTVLLVDADAAIRATIRAELESHGYTVIEAPDGSSAIDAARRYSGRISVLITDLRMAGINGFRLSEHLSRIAPDLKTVFMSEYSADLLSTDMRSPGCRYLRKPVIHASLLRAIEQLVPSCTEQPANEAPASH